MRTVIVAAALMLIAGATTSHAQLPSKQVRLVVPAAPGGSFDALARILAQSLSDRWPQRVIVDNRPGGAGNIGAREVIKADPDGATLLVWNDTLLINPSLFKEPPFDPKRDFAPVSLSMYAPNVLAAHPSANLKTFGDFLSAARANPGKLSYGSPGVEAPAICRSSSSSTSHRSTWCTSRIAARGRPSRHGGRTNSHGHGARSREPSGISATAR